MSLSETIMVAGLLLFAVFMLLVLFESRAFLRHLEAHHPGEFAKLGFPNWKIQWGDRSLRLAMKYIRQRQFAPLHDAALEKSYRAIRLYDRLGWALAAAAFIAALAGPFIGR